METLLSWTAPSRPHKPLDKQLFSVGLVVALLISTIMAFAGEWMLIVVIASMFFAYYSWAKYPPENTTYTITTNGLNAHGQVYTWDNFTRWWLEGDLLIFEAPQERFKRIFLVTSPDITLEKLTPILEAYLPYDKPAPTQLDKLASWLTRTFPLSK